MLFTPQERFAAKPDEERLVELDTLRQVMVVGLDEGWVPGLGRSCTHGHSPSRPLHGQLGS